MFRMLKRAYCWGTTVLWILYFLQQVGWSEQPEAEITDFELISHPALPLPSRRFQSYNSSSVNETLFEVSPQEELLNEIPFTDIVSLREASNSISHESINLSLLQTLPNPPIFPPQDQDFLDVPDRFHQMHLNLTPVTPRNIFDMNEGSASNPFDTQPEGLSRPEIDAFTEGQAEEIRNSTGGITTTFSYRNPKYVQQRIPQADEFTENSSLMCPMQENITGVASLRNLSGSEERMASFDSEYERRMELTKNSDSNEDELTHVSDHKESSVPRTEYDSGDSTANEINS
jgi:hypothetical protein